MSRILNNKSDSKIKSLDILSKFLIISGLIGGPLAIIVDIVLWNELRETNIIMLIPAFILIFVALYLIRARKKGMWIKWIENARKINAGDQQTIREYLQKTRKQLPIYFLIGFVFIFIGILFPRDTVFMEQI